MGSTTEHSSIKTFYDDYVETQRESGINDRVYGLYQRLIKRGLKADSQVLELGCGIGTLTYLLSKKITHGKIEAVDISPASVAVAQKKINNPDVQFFTHDIVDFHSTLPCINYITLFDIIEHIPLEQHPELFHHLRKNCMEHTRIFLNIPNPSYLQFEQEHEPESLQIIDQPIFLRTLLEQVENEGFELVYFETYSIWVEKDYQFFELVPKKNFELKKLSDQRTFLEKAGKKMWRSFLKWKYPF